MRPGGRVAVVVGGGGPPAITRADLGDLGDDPLVVAADSGLIHAPALGLRVDRVVGDMDSVRQADLAAAADAGVTIDRHPAAKDATDLDLALEAALATGPSRVVVVTGAGDRFDHALAVALSVSAPARGCGGVGEGAAVGAGPGPAVVPVEAWIGPAHVWVVRDEVTLHGRPGDLLTLLPVHGPAYGVTTSGLLYPLADEDLDAGTSRGVSNEWAEPVATVRVRAGVLLAVAPGATGTHWARASGR